MRRERWVGLGLIATAIGMAVIFFLIHNYTSSVVDQFVSLGGECNTSQGCLHDKATNWLLIGMLPTVLVLAAGIYVGFFLKVTTYGDKLKRDEVFDVMLQSLSEDEALVMRVVREEEGITQATLKYRVNLSKSKVSQLLSDLEKRGLVSREDAGTTKKIFLRSPETKV